MGLTVVGIVTRGSDIRIIVPGVRRLVATDPDGVVLDVIGPVYAQAEAIHAVAAERGSETVGVFTASVQQLGGDHLTALNMLPIIRQILVGDVHHRVVSVFRIDVQSQFDDTVAAVLMAGQGIVVNTDLRQEPRPVHLRQTEPQRVALTDRIHNQGVHDRQYLDMHKPGTVVAIESQGVESVVAGVDDVVPILPGIRRLVVADIEGVLLDVVGLMYPENQAVYTVAAVNALHREGIDAGGIEVLGRVFGLTVCSFPGVRPDIRDSAVGDVHDLRYRHDAVAHVEVERHDRVAAVDRHQGVAVDTRGMDILLDGSVIVLADIMAVELNGVARADGIEEQGVADDTVVHAEVIDAVAAVVCDERVGVMTRLHIETAYREMLYVSVVPGVRQTLVLFCTDIYRIAVVIRRIDVQIELPDIGTGVAEGRGVFCRSDGVIDAGVVTPCAAPPGRVA